MITYAHLRKKLLLLKNNKFVAVKKITYSNLLFHMILLNVKISRFKLIRCSD